MKQASDVFNCQLSAQGPGQPAADGAGGNVALGVIHGLLQALDAPVDFRGAAVCGDPAGQGAQLLPPGKSLLQKLQPALKHRDQGVPLPFLHGNQHICQLQGLLFGKGADEASLPAASMMR